MLRSIRWAACVAFLLGGVPQASATIYQVDFAGQFVGGFYIGPGHTEVNLTGATYTAEFIFDSTLMTLGTSADGRHELTGQGSAAVIEISGFGTLTILNGPTNFIFNDDFTSIVANVGADFHHVFISTELFLNGGRHNGFVQSGTCPSGPCGPLSVDSFTVLIDSAPVPLPVAGSGLPGLIALGATYLAWRRRYAA